MNPITAILNLFKKRNDGPTETNQRRLDGYNALQKGGVFYGKGQLREALDCFDAAIDNGFEDGGIYRSRGLCLQSLNFDLDAIDDFDKAIASEPQDSNLYYMRSISKGATGDLHGRVSDLQEAVRLASVENAANRSYNAFAKEKGYKNGVIGIYEADLLLANLDLESQATQERVRRECPGDDLGLDLVSRRRAKARRRTPH